MLETALTTFCPSPSTPPAPVHGSIAHVCAVHGLSRSTVTRSIAAGHFTAFRLGGKVMIELASVDRYLNSLPRMAA